MPSLTIRGIPETLLERLRRSAGQHRRSLNSEVLHRLERSIVAPDERPRERLARIRMLREATALPYLTDEVLRNARDEGRP